ncbi:hypothetical protein B4087_0643 [Bacillus cereus]|nr:hypothetical protein B4087_0643 [Bacillus cereus]
MWLFPIHNKRKLSNFSRSVRSLILLLLKYNLVTEFIENNGLISLISFPIKSSTFTFFNLLNGVKSLILLSRKYKNCSFSSWEIGSIFSIGFIYKPNVFNFFKLDSGDISFTLDSCSPNVSRFTICCKPSKLSIPIPKYTFNSLICAASSSVIGVFISVRCKTFLLIYCCNLLSDIIFFTCCCSSFFSFDSSILLFSE